MPRRIRVKKVFHREDRSHVEPFLLTSLFTPVAY